MHYPVKLNDNYTCQGIDADGEQVYYDDLLKEGDQVGSKDADENVFVDARVVRRADGLWVVAWRHAPPPYAHDVRRGDYRADGTYTERLESGVMQGSLGIVRVEPAFAESIFAWFEVQAARQLGVFRPQWTFPC